jgi:hypothetical protein
MKAPQTGLQEKEAKQMAPQKEFHWQGRLAPKQTIEIQIAACQTESEKGRR